MLDQFACPGRVVRILPHGGVEGLHRACGLLECTGLRPRAGGQLQIAGNDVPARFVDRIAGFLVAGNELAHAVHCKVGIVLELAERALVLGSDLLAEVAVSHGVEHPRRIAYRSG